MLLDIVGRDSPQIIGLSVPELGLTPTSSRAALNFAEQEIENFQLETGTQQTEDAFSHTPGTAAKVFLERVFGCEFFVPPPKNFFVPPPGKPHPHSNTPIRIY